MGVQRLERLKLLTSELDGASETHVLPWIEWQQEVEERLGVLPPDYKLAVRCGRCRRTLEVFRVHPAGGGGVRGDSELWPSLKDDEPAHAEAREYRSTRALKDHRPSIRARFTGSTYTLMCHKRCGARYSIRWTRISAAFLLAIRAGRTEIVAGQDV